MVRAEVRLRFPRRHIRSNKGLNHGTTLFTQHFKGRRARDAQAQARDTQERPEQENGQEPQAGDRDRPVGSAPERKEGSEEAQGLMNTRLGWSPFVGRRPTESARAADALYARPSLTASPRTFWPSASNALATMPLASRPAAAYIAAGES